MRNLSAKKAWWYGAATIALFAAIPLLAAPTKEARNEPQDNQATHVVTASNEAPAGHALEEKDASSVDKPIAPSEQPSPAEVKAVEAAEASAAATEPSTKVLRVAQRELKLGYHETPINCTKYGSWYGEHCAEWCDIFVSWVFNQAGYLLAVGGKHDNVDKHIQWFEDHKRYHAQPCLGCVIFIDWNHNHNPDHVGIVRHFTRTRVYTIEGNRSNKVASLGYNRSDPKILGYGYPDWKACPSESVYTCCHCSGSSSCGCRPRNMSPANYCGC